MAVQGTAGICKAMLPYMPDGATVDELQQAISNATDGVGVIFQPESMGVIAELAGQHDSLQLADLSQAKPLLALLWRVGSHVMIGNFIAETVVKTLRRSSTARTQLSAATRPTRQCSVLRAIVVPRAGP